MAGYARPHAALLRKRLAEPRRFLLVLAGPRPAGKTTLARQVAERLGRPQRYASADEPTLRGRGWIAEQWEAARLETGRRGALLVLDEIQKIPGWSETVKRLWDEDTRAKRPLKVVLLGSAPLLVQRGLTESLAGRFELPRGRFPGAGRRAFTRLLGTPRSHRAAPDLDLSPMSKLLKRAFARAACPRTSRSIGRGAAGKM